MTTYQATSANSSVSGNTRTWNVSYTFNAAGNRTMTFKASDTSTTTDAGKAVSFSVTEQETAGNVTVNSASVASSAVSKGTPVNFTVTTSEDAQYLIMYREGDILVTTYQATSANSSVSGSTRTWNVTYTFNGAGSRTMTFKAGTTSTPSASSKAVSFTVQ